MSETPTTRKLSRTEIAMRTRGVIADVMGRAPVDCPETSSAVELRIDEMDACQILARLEDSFDIMLGFDAEKAVMRGTVGELIDLVEGQVSAGSIS